MRALQGELTEEERPHHHPDMGHASPRRESQTEYQCPSRSASLLDGPHILTPRVKAFPPEVAFVGFSTFQCNVGSVALGALGVPS